MPANTVKVDRSTRWGNPLRVRPDYSAAQAVADYARWLEGRALRGLAHPAQAPPTANAIKGALRGRNLACWCRLGEPCHADILLRIANDGEKTPQESGALPTEIDRPSDEREAYT